MESEEKIKAIPTLQIGETMGAAWVDLKQSCRSRRIYIASSWKNAKIVRTLAVLLRIKNHQVFDFTDPEHRVLGIPGESQEVEVDNFVFDASVDLGKPREEIEWKEFLEHPATKRAFKVDKVGLDWADTVLMLLPCGRNAHLEAGYAVGRGKSLFIFGSLPRGEYEAMYGFAEGCYRTEEIAALFDRLSLTKLQAESKLDFM